MMNFVLAKSIGDIINDLTFEDIVLYGLIPMMILLGICAIILQSAAKAKRRENEAKPILTEMVTAIDVQTEELSFIGPRTVFLFEAADGRRIRFTHMGAHQIVVGDRGLLKWQGDTIISFVREKTEK